MTRCTMPEMLPRVTPPVPQPESDFYWEKCKLHELWIKTCKDCSTSYFYPRDICPGCFSRNTSWIQASGTGIIHAFTIVYRAPTPQFQDRVPFVAAVVELDEGPKIPTNIIEIEPDPTVVKIGTRVTVEFEDLNDEISLPMFKPL
ncbi:MAG TPA: hypothetical protein DEZ08_01010 [Dehalococcoidia bacterium]|nr:hypothetical protein [Dehalococcoidia bacterium]